jgi:endonuclease I
MQGCKNPNVSVTFSGLKNIPHLNRIWIYIKALLMTGWLLSIPFIVISQPPAGYYNNANGLTGNSLQLALHDIIKNHTAISYNALWNAFYFTDDKQPGNVCWDMYSDIPGGTPSYIYILGTDQCATTPGYEGACYNREHSFPKSWFGGEIDPMYTDLFHLVPADSYVNTRRNNNPYGTVNTPTWTSTNGSKLGPCSYAGYTGTVFEPIDAFKGDLARNYFYMAVRYADIIAGWENNDPDGDAVLDGTQYPAFEPWFIQLLMQWSYNDPVDQKEIDRNNEIYLRYQGNRNPFIDNPEYAALIWPSYVPTGASVSTADAASVNMNSAVSGGNATSDGGSAITARGVCWSTNLNPTIADNHTTNGSGTGTFTSNITGLLAGTTYYVRAYITNSLGTFYGFSKQFTTTCSTYSLPFSESFSVPAIPNCWYQIDYLGNGQVWKFGVITNQSPNPALSGYYAYLNSAAYGNSNSQNVDLVSPSFDMSGFADVTLGFEHFFRSYSGSSGKVSYSINNGATWTLLAQFTTQSATNPAVFNQMIPELSGQPQVRFKWNYTGSFAFYWAIDNVQVTGTISNTLNVTPASQSVSSANGTTNFNVSSNTNWTTMSDASWCTVTPSGTGSMIITSDYLQNESVIARTANITLTVSGLSPVVVTVEQDGATPYLTASPLTQLVSFNATSAEFTIQSNTNWTAVSNMIWCTVTPSGSGNSTLTATFGQNTGSQRSANITISAAGALPVILTLIQGTIEPSAFPGNFSSHNIVLHWNDATGQILPTAYLVRMSTISFSSIQAPQDGIPVPDGIGDKNILYGVQQAAFSGLIPNTVYYFKLYAYTGSGNSIQYKTTGSIPQLQVTTSP